MPTDPHDHLSSIDPDAWPSIAEVPTGVFSGTRSRRAESEFAAVCEKARLRLDGSDPDLRVLYDDLFNRIAYAGWLGFAEGYMAQEWESSRLVDVLVRLLEVGYRPRFSGAKVGGSYTGLELPDSLVALFSGDGMSGHGTVFSSGVATTERISYKSYVPGAGRGHQPRHHFVDVTEISEPQLVERADLGDAQLRAITMLLDAARVSVGSHLLDFPSSGAAVPVSAVHRHALVDVLSADADQVAAVRETLKLVDVDASVHVELLDEPFPQPREWPASYDAIISVEKLETMGIKEKQRYFRVLDRLLGAQRYLAMQTVVATEGFTSACNSSLDVLRAYLWPALDYVNIEKIHQLCDAHTQLRVVSQTHIGRHYVKGLQLQRETFEAHMRDAAASGYDNTYRRLVVFQLALREALFRVGAVDAVQLVIGQRRRLRN